MAYAEKPLASLVFCISVNYQGNKLNTWFQYASEKLNDSSITDLWNQMNFISSVSIDSLHCIKTNASPSCKLLIAILKGNKLQLKYITGIFYPGRATTHEMLVLTAVTNLRRQSPLHLLKDYLNVTQDFWIFWNMVSH